MKLWHVNLFCAIFCGVFGFYLIFAGNVVPAIINLSASFLNVISVHLATRPKSP
jgi:hypothetical protein